MALTQPNSPQEPTKTAETVPEKPGKLRAALRFLSSALLFLIVFWVFLVVLNAKRQNKVPAFFGYSFSIVVTGSMEPDIGVGDLLIVKETGMEEIEVGDDILFVSLSGEIAGEHIVHRVIEKGTDERGIYFRTQGTNNPIPDLDRVHGDNFVGKAVAHSAALGKVFSFLTNVESIMMIAVVIFTVPFIVRQVVRIVRIAKSEEGGDDEKPQTK